MLAKVKNQLGFVIILIFWFGTLGVLSQVSIFQVKKVVCALTDGQTCPEKLLAKTQTLKDQSLFFTDFRKTFVDTQNPAFDFKVKSIKKVFPNQVKVLFEPIKLSYLLETETKSYLITDSAIVLDAQNIAFTLPKVISKNKDLSLIKQTTNLSIIDPEFHQNMMHLIQALNQEQIQFEELTYFSPHQVVAKLNQNIKVIIDVSEVKMNVSRLKVVLDNKDFENLKLTDFIIDVRFSLPVLRNQE